MKKFFSSFNLPLVLMLLPAATALSCACLHAAPAAPEIRIEKTASMPCHHETRAQETKAGQDCCGGCEISHADKADTVETGQALLPQTSRVFAADTSHEAAPVFFQHAARHYGARGISPSHAIFLPGSVSGLSTYLAVHRLLI